MRKSAFRLQNRHSYSWWFFATSLVVVIAFFLFRKSDTEPELLLSLVGALAAFFYFLYGQHNFDAEQFTALFKDFNIRFDELNGDLNRIRTAPSNEPISQSDLQVLYDYFNLCAEEYLYYKAGYIDEAVWKSWTRGMAYFADSERLRGIWSRELKQDSYYGFSLDLLASVA